MSDLQSLLERLKGGEDERVVAMLRTLAEHRGVVDCSDAWADEPLRPWYDDRGRDTDTFNLAIEAGLMTTSHDSDSDTSTAYITDAGRTLLQALIASKSPSEPSA